MALRCASGVLPEQSASHSRHSAIVGPPPPDPPFPPPNNNLRYDDDKDNDNDNGRLWERRGVTSIDRKDLKCVVVVVVVVVVFWSGLYLLSSRVGVLV